MASLQIELPEEIKAVAQARAAQEGYATMDQYLERLICDDAEPFLSPQMEAQILEGLNTPSEQWTPDRFNEKLHNLRKRLHATGSP